VELFSDWLPVVWNLFLPRRPVLLFLVDVKLKYSIAVGEHRFNVTENVVDFSATGFINSDTNRPNDAKYKPFLDVE